MRLSPVVILVCSLMTGGALALSVSGPALAVCVSAHGVTNCGGGGGGGNCYTDAYWIYVYESKGQVDLGGTDYSNNGLYSPCVSTQVSISASGIASGYSFFQWVVIGGSVSCDTCSSTTFTSASSPTTGSITMSLQLTSYTTWGGYIASGSQLGSATGTFNIPTVSYQGGTDAMAYWVGIGGVNGNLWQAGVAISVSSGGGVTIQAFYEAVESGCTCNAQYYSFPGGMAEGAQAIVDVAYSSGMVYWNVGYWNYINLVWWNGSLPSTSFSPSFTPDQTTVEWIGEAENGKVGFTLPAPSVVTFTYAAFDGSAWEYSPICASTLEDPNYNNGDQYLTPSLVSGGVFEDTYST